MAKTKSTFVCQSCGTHAAKWIGRCPSCGEWNSFVEEIISTNKSHSSSAVKGFSSRPKRLEEINDEDIKRLHTGNNEFDRVVGGGLVPGSVILIGGEPGIGKSTLVLQLALQLDKVKILYISGEESQQQLKMRANRLGGGNEELFFISENSLEANLKHLEEIEPALIVVDSIQTMVTDKAESSAGSITQIRECTAELLHFAKNRHIPLILIGHINKEGHLAGPKVLEHIVDTVLQFEGDQNHMYRILRSRKNRFGSTDELGIYEMQQGGLREVSNPSEMLLANRDMPLSGNAVSASMEGHRPMLIQTQALVSTAAYGTPQRSTTGFDNRRLNMLLAVLEKRAGFRLAIKDVFLNMAGGLKVSDPATDMAVLAAILSSDKNEALSQNICFTGELGLSGEIRPVSRIEQRVSEAERLGFTQIFIPAGNLKKADFNQTKIQIIPVKHVGELYKKIL
ncbi:MAG: DNA repair protein RadA [Bacteroidales bacterium]|nr:DNA repair protein RadA [Bacteroidales bacterium]